MPASSLLHVRGLIVAVAVMLLLFIDDTRKAVWNMENRSSKINLTTFALKDVSSVNALALIESRQGALLLTSTTKGTTPGLSHSQTVISSTPLAGGVATTAATPTPLFNIEHLLPPPPDWDVCSNPDGSYSLTYEMALGATYTVLYRQPKKPDAPVTAAHPFESFTSPRFIKKFQNNLSHPLTAIAEKRTAVLFMPDEYGNYRKYVKLNDAINALILKRKDEFVLFYKVIEPGAVRGNLIYPGRLYYVRLTKNFATASPKPVEPFGNQIVFEFDADVSGEQITIFATSQNNLLLAQSSSLSSPYKLVDFGGQYDAQKLTQPSVLLSRSQVYLAVLESAQTDKARILTATATLQSIQ